MNTIKKILFLTIITSNFLFVALFLVALFLLGRFIDITEIIGYFIIILGAIFLLSVLTLAIIKITEKNDGKAENRFFTKNAKIIILSLIIGIFITAITGLIGPRCGLEEPGGVKSGWRGLPVMYYECGMWGDTFFQGNQCLQEYETCKNHYGKNNCLLETRCIRFDIVWPILAILIDIGFWTLLAFFLINRKNNLTKQP